MLPRTPLYTPADIRQIAEHGEHTMDRRMAAAIFDLMQRIETIERLLRKELPEYDTGVTDGAKAVLRLIDARPIADGRDPEADAWENEVAETDYNPIMEPVR